MPSGYLGAPQKGESLTSIRTWETGSFATRQPRPVSIASSCRWDSTSAISITTAISISIWALAARRFTALSPNVLFHNDGGKRFTDITALSGTGILPKGHGIAFADIDNDGDEDLVAVMGGAVPGDQHNARLFENPGNGNDWISVHLTGVKSNRAAVGARIKVTVLNEGNAPRDIYRTVGSGDPSVPPRLSSI